LLKSEKCSDFPGTGAKYSPTLPGALRSFNYFEGPWVMETISEGMEVISPPE